MGTRDSSQTHTAVVEELEKMTIAELERQVNSMKFVIERLTERVEKLERAPKPDRTTYYENWGYDRKD